MNILFSIQGQTSFDVADTDMFRHLEEIKKQQNKEELLNKKQIKKRAEAKGRQPDAEPETPSKVKKVEVEIEEQENEKENTCNMTENAVGKLGIIININLKLFWSLINMFSSHAALKAKWKFHQVIVRQNLRVARRKLNQVVIIVQMMVSCTWVL